MRRCRAGWGVRNFWMRFDYRQCLPMLTRANLHFKKKEEKKRRWGINCRTFCQSWHMRKKLPAWSCAADGMLKSDYHLTSDGASFSKVSHQKSDNFVGYWLLSATLSLKVTLISETYLGCVPTIMDLFSDILYYWIWGWKAVHSVIDRLIDSWLFFLFLFFFFFFWGEGS